MEYAIAVFVGLWIMGAGLLAYHRINKDFASTGSDKKSGKKGGKKQ